MARLRDAFIELLSRRPVYYYQFREGDDLAVPVNSRDNAATVLMIDHENGSAAETFAMMFKLKKIGPLVGLRTGGGGVGPYGRTSFPAFVDGGQARVSARTAYNPAGTWDIENHGIVPDRSVDVLPIDWRNDRDLKLEAAVAASLESIGKAPPTTPKRPPIPVHSR